MILSLQQRGSDAGMGDWVKYQMLVTFSKKNILNVIFCGKFVLGSLHGPTTTLWLNIMQIG